MKKDRQDAYIQKLKEKHVHRPCPRCEETEFDLVGETVLPVQKDPALFKAGETAGVPAVMIACRNCGFISLHAQAPLGMAKGRYES